MVDFNQRLRDQMLREAIAQAAPDTSLAAVIAFLPADFDADEAELADMLATMAAEPTPAQRDAAAMVQSLMGIEPDQPIEFEGAPEPTPAPQPVETLDTVEPVSDEPTLTFQEARAVVVDWGNKLSAARGRLMTAVSRQQAGRDKLHAAIKQFVSGFPKKTREDLQREYLASEAERRQRVHDGLEPPTGGTRQVPAGFLTASRFHQRGGSVNRGYGNKHVKRAASLIAQQEARGLKPAVGAAKLPSQR
jgi:hypothetical protein